jgi:hypothetical protein
MTYPVLVGEGHQNIQDAYGPMWGIPVTVIEVSSSSSARSERYFRCERCHLSGDTCASVTARLDVLGVGASWRQGRRCQHLDRWSMSSYVHLEDPSSAEFANTITSLIGNGER